METILRMAKPEDTASVVRLWNRHFLFDPLTEERFQSVVFEDPLFDPNGTFVLIHNQEIVGFADCVIDAKSHIGHLKELLAYGEGADLVRAKLHEAVEKFLFEKKCAVVRVGNYPGGRYVFPGIDLRYEEDTAFLKQAGFLQTEEIQDMSVDLTSFAVSDQQKKKLEKLSDDGIQIQRYQAALLPAMREFVRELDMHHWFPDKWEDQWQEGKDVIVALKGERIIGYAEMEITGDKAAFGPLAVLLECRDQGVGSCVLIESMLWMQKRGVASATAGWVWPPQLYEKNGWSVWRRYVFFEKKYPTFE